MKPQQVKVQNNLLPQEHPFRYQLSPRSFKKEIQVCITKFNSKDTRQQSLQDALNLMELNFQQPKIVLQCLQEANGKFDQVETKEVILITLAQVCKMIKLMYGEDSSQEKDALVSKIVALNILSFKETKKSIQQACLRVIVDLFMNCVKSDDTPYQMLVLYQPIEQILLGGSQLSAQETASFCLSTFLQYLMSQNCNLLLSAMATPIMQMFLKPSVEQPNLLQSIFIATQFIPKLTSLSLIVEKVLKYVTIIAMKQNNQHTQTNTLVQACLYFQLLATLHISKKRDIDISTLQEFQRELVQENLFKLSSDSRMQVSQTAKLALAEWLKALQIKKQIQDIQIQDLKALRDQKKIQKQELDNDKQIEMLNNESLVRNSDLYNIDFLQQNHKEGKGFGSHIRGSNYIRKGTGLGAGQAAVDQISMEQHKPKIEPYQKRIQQLYELIQQPERNLSAQSPQRQPSPKCSLSDILKERQQRVVSAKVVHRHAVVPMSQPIKDAELVDSLENWYPPAQQKNKITTPKQLTKVESPSQPRIQNYKPKKIKQTFSSEPVQDDFIFKSQTFELSNSTLHEFLAHEQNEKVHQEVVIPERLVTIHEVQSEVQYNKFPRLPDEQFLVVSGCFDEQFKLNCEQFHSKEIKNQIEEEPIQDFIDLQVEYLIKQNEEILKDFSKAQLESAVYQNLETKPQNPINQFSVESMIPQKQNLEIKPPQPQQEVRNFQRLIKNPPKKLIKVQQAHDFVSQQVDEQHYNSLKTKLVKREALYQEKMKQYDKMNLQERWIKALELVEVENYEEAYQCIMRSDDDIYLIRLMSVTGPCVKRLSQETAQILATRIKKLMISEFWKVLGLKIISGLKEIPLPIEQDLRMQSLLFKWSQSWNPEISYESAQLYNQLSQ